MDVRVLTLLDFWSLFWCPGLWTVPRTDLNVYEFLHFVFDIWGLSNTRNAPRQSAPISTNNYRTPAADIVNRYRYIPHQTMSSPPTPAADTGLTSIEASAASNGDGGGAATVHHHDDDGVDVDEDKEVEKEFDLARRTGEIMDRYREYITEIGTSGGVGEGGGTNGDSDHIASTAGLAPHNPFRYDIHGGLTVDDEDDIVAFDGSNDYSTKVISAAATFLSSGGIRDFSIPEEDDEEHGATAGGLYSKRQLAAASPRNSSSSSSNQGHHYQYNLLKSKRFKRWMLTFLLLMSVIAVAVGVSKSIKERNLPDWDKELANEEEAEEAEKKKNQQGMAEPNISQQATQSSNGDGSKISPVLAHALDAEGNYINMAIRYKPIWLSRDADGYDGSNYEAGVEYCAARDPSMLPCPYEAYCPEGERAVPAGGYKGDDNAEDGGVVQWAPILDQENGWVQVSPNGNNACVLYETLHAEAPLPDWGVSGINVDETKYVLCCAASAFDSSSGSMVPFSTTSDGSDSSATTASEESTAVVAAPEKDEENSAEVIMTDVLSHATNITQSKSFDTDDKYLEMAYKYQPTWYSRKVDGYLGVNFNDAVDYCSQQDPAMFPCPYEAYCPGGLNNVPAGGYMGDTEEVVQWAPFLDYADAWVQVSSQDGNACVPYDVLNGQKPMWAENGVNEQQTRYLMCCVTSAFDDVSAQDSMLADSSSSSSSGTSAVDTTDTTTPPDVVTSSEGEILESNYGPNVEDNPQWYNRDSGWSGSTYVAAKEFCADHASGTDSNGVLYTGTLCSYEDYCPNGPRDLPFGGATKASTVQWSPMSDFRNEWVQVGGEGDLCIPYSVLNMEKPKWGTSGKNTEGTQFIMCCRFYDATLSNEESDTDAEITDALLHAINVTQSSGFEETDAKYLEMVYKYEPLWFSRDDGNYTGTTLLDAIEFCYIQVNSMIPCPYEAYCPGGPHNVPAGGYKGDGHELLQWVPIFGDENAWVSVSPNDGDSCVTYDEIFGMAPVWGENGVNEQQTRYVMCCSMSAFETPSSNGTDVDEIIADTVLSQSVPDSGVIVTTEYGQVDDDDPQWYNRDSGWVGSTFAEAVEFCATSGSGTDFNGVNYEGTLCSYEAYCPEGLRGLPYGGATKASTVQWAPMSDFDNEWVQVGSEGEMCSTYTALNMEAPSWGITGGNEQSTQFLMCCRKYNAGSAATSSSTSPTSPEIVSTDSAELLGAEILGQEIGTILERIDPKYKMVAFGRNQGWEGSTYDEAATFCNWRVKSYEPCTYAAVCPNGLADFSSTEGAIWVPIDGVVYSYVELGVGGSCAGQKTLSAVSDVTRYLLCCMLQ